MPRGFQGQVYPFPPNFMHPGHTGYNHQQQQQDSSQSAVGGSTTNQSNPSSNSNSTTQEATSPQVNQAEGAGQQNTPTTPREPELRHRTGAMPRTNQDQNTGGRAGNLPLIREDHGAQPSCVVAPLVLMSIITVIMFCLLLRRIYITVGYKFDFGLWAKKCTI